MCFGGGSVPKPKTNPAPYSLDQSHTAVQASVQAATADDLAALEPEATAIPAVPLRTQQTGIYFTKQG